MAPMAVSSRKKSKQTRQWRVVLLKSSPARYLGRVEAADQQSAIDEAVKTFGIRETLKFKLLAVPDRL